MKNSANPVKNTIPDILSPFIHSEGCEFLGRNLPITNL